MPTRTPASIVMGRSSQGEIAGIEYGRRWRALSVVQAGERHKRFDGRAGRINAPQGAIIKGFVQRVVVVIPTGLINTVDKQIGIKARLADEGQNFSVVRIDRN